MWKNGGIVSHRFSFASEIIRRRKINYRSGKENGLMAKIIHTADIHLDAPFSLLDVQTAQMRKNELRETFSSIVQLAESEKADIMIIAGDLFDSGFVTKETTALLASLFSSIGEIFGIGK